VCGYPIVARVAGLLGDSVDRAVNLDERKIGLIEAHIDTMLTIVDGRTTLDSSDAHPFLANRRIFLGRQMARL